jgi:hypothetical protein
MMIMWSAVAERTRDGAPPLNFLAEPCDPKSARTARDSGQVKIGMIRPVLLFTLLLATPAAAQGPCLPGDGVRDGVLVSLRHQHPNGRRSTREATRDRVVSRKRSPTRPPCRARGSHCRRRPDRRRDGLACARLDNHGCEGGRTEAEVAAVESVKALRLRSFQPIIRPNVFLGSWLCKNGQGQPQPIRIRRIVRIDQQRTFVNNATAAAAASAPARPRTTRRSGPS